MAFPNVNPGWASRVSPLSPQMVSFTAPDATAPPPPPIGTNRSEILAYMLQQPQGPAPLSAGQAIVEGLGKGLEGWALGNKQEQEERQKQERGSMMAEALGVPRGDPRHEPMATLLATGAWSPPGELIADRFGFGQPTEQWEPTEMFGMPGQQSSTTGKFDPFPAGATVNPTLTEIQDPNGPPGSIVKAWVYPDGRPPVIAGDVPPSDDDLITTDKPIFNPQTGEWTMPPTMEGGGLFSGTSVEAQSLNYLVKNKIITPQQAAELGAGKTITDPSTGAMLFMTPTGIFSKASPDAPAVLVELPQQQDVAPAPQSDALAAPETPMGTDVFAPPGQGPLAVPPPREGMIPLTSPSPGANLTPAEKAIDTSYAQDYAQWVGRGGYADVEKQIAQLEEAATALESGAGHLSGPIVGLTPDIVGSFVNQDAIATRQAIEEVVQRNLRLILGAQFTQKEGENLIARAYNPSLDEAENSKRVRRLIKQMRAAAEAQDSAAEYFEQNGTLKGWSGRFPTKSDINLETDDPANDPLGLR